jgi:hypothetical protein
MSGGVFAVRGIIANGRDNLDLEECRVFRCDAAWLLQVPTFHRILLPPGSASN